jgi:phosphoribosylaminoimidazole carboxylase PurE protein
MGSDSDLVQMKSAAEILDEFNISYELTIVSAHRTPLRLVEYAQSARSRGLSVIIAGAGGAAHLPGMVASLTSLPVIGVPIHTSVMNGQDSLLSIVQMPRGIPVATVAIGNSMNAGLLAVRIIAAAEGKDGKLADRIEQYAKEMEEKVMEKAKVLESVGFRKYLEKS